MSDILVVIGKNVRNLRIRRGWTQEELARRAEVYPSLVSRIENAKYNLYLHTLMSIADALSVPAEDLLK